jgi:hypothetical protein
MQTINTNAGRIQSIFNSLYNYTTTNYVIYDSYILLLGNCDRTSSHYRDINI